MRKTALWLLFVACSQSEPVAPVTDAGSDLADAGADSADGGGALADAGPPCPGCAGCCQDGVCKAGTGHSACGTGGWACVACASNESCESGLCVPSCDDTTCAGCCKDGVCKTGDTLAACGNGGQTCAKCSDSTQSCFENQCVDEMNLWVNYWFHPGTCYQDALCSLAARVRLSRADGLANWYPNCAIEAVAGLALPTYRVTCPCETICCSPPSGAAQFECKWNQVPWY